MEHVVETHNPPRTVPGKIIQEIDDLATIFTDHWFGRPAKKTNERLIELCAEITSIKVYIMGMETQFFNNPGSVQCTINLVDWVNRYDPKSLGRVLRIGGDEAQKQKMVSSRTRLIELWVLLRKLVQNLFRVNSGK